ncbi:unnamed protein product, partial [Prorocentrum cordatum]
MGAEQSAQGIGPEAAPRAMCARQGGDAALSLADLLPPAPPAPAAGVQQLPDGGPGDQRLLAHVAALLSQREGGTLLLSDLGALLPKDLRDRARMRGGLRSALQKYHMLVSVTGAPGKESVTSLLKGSELQSLPLFQKRGPDAKTGGHAASRIAAAAPQSACPESMSPSRREEDENHESVLQLRGLPYRATVTDVKGFLGRHGRNLKDERLGHPIRLIMNRDGRPSGFACVQLNSPMAARAARDELNGRMLDVAGGASVDGGAVRGGRYVEVFLFSERPNKLRFKNLLSADVPQEQAGGQDCHEVTAEEVRAECCAHMGVPGKGQLLLSMLGVALSPGARNYLKKTDQGLKQFLSRYPRQFFVEGAKGRESITYVAPASAAAAGQDGGRAPGGLQQRPGEGGSRAGSGEPGPRRPARQAAQAGQARERRARASQAGERRGPHPHEPGADRGGVEAGVVREHAEHLGRLPGRGPRRGPAAAAAPAAPRGRARARERARPGDRPGDAHGHVRGLAATGAASAGGARASVRLRVPEGPPGAAVERGGRGRRPAGAAAAAGGRGAAAGAGGARRGAARAGPRGGRPRGLREAAGPAFHLHGAGRAQLLLQVRRRGHDPQRARPRPAPHQGQGPQVGPGHRAAEQPVRRGEGAGRAAGQTDGGALHRGLRRRGRPEPAWEAHAGAHADAGVRRRRRPAGARGRWSPAARGAAAAAARAAGARPGASSIPDAAVGCGGGVGGHRRHEHPREGCAEEVVRHGQPGPEPARRPPRFCRAAAWGMGPRRLADEG